MTTYVALLRGINVGGRTKVGMADPQQVFADLGHTDVQTYLQSGNVIFTGHEKPASDLAGDVAKRIALVLGLPIAVLLRTGDELGCVVANNPFLGRESDFAKLYVTFLADEPDLERAACFETPAGQPDELSLAGREVFLLPGGPRIGWTPMRVGKEVGSECASHCCPTPTATRLRSTRSWRTSRPMAAPTPTGSWEISSRSGTTRSAYSSA